MSRGDCLKNIEKIIDDFLIYNKASVFKISGYGEVNLWGSALDLLKKYSNYYPAVQLITNGSLNKEIIVNLSKIRNIVICQTLDGHTVEMNKLRVKNNEKLQKILLDNLKLAVKLGIPVEINSVITRINSQRYEDFLNYLNKRYANKIMLFPFPVRQFYDLSNKNLFPTNKDVEILCRLFIDNYDKYREILPPLPYLERFIDFIINKKRIWKCDVFKVNFGVGPNFKMLNCACAGQKKFYGDVHDGFYKLLKLRNKLIVKNKLVTAIELKCSTCFTHYEVINLFLNNEINEKDFSRIPSFRFKNSLSIIKRLKFNR